MPVSETALERANRAHPSDGDVIALTPEGDLVTGADAEIVAQFLGYDDLPLRSDPVSHTREYNRWLPPTSMPG